MAAWLGQWLRFAVCWGVQHEGRIQPPSAVYLVRRPFPMGQIVEGFEMKTPGPTKAEPSAPNRREFTGTDNPRHLRAIHALLQRPRRREDVDAIAGCSNAPELIAELRRRGLGKEHLPCERVDFIDRDGKPCRPGVYSLPLPH